MAQPIEGVTTSATAGEHHTPADTIKIPQHQDQRPSKASLLGLPAELRNQIYRNVLVERDPIEVDCYHWADPVHKPCHFTMTAPLTMVSRQLKQETQAIFLLENVFEFQSDLLSNHSTAPIRAFRELWRNTGVELQRLDFNLQQYLYVDQDPFNNLLYLDTHTLYANFILVKYGDGLDMAWDDTYGVCGRRILALVRQCKGAPDSIIRFLGRLRLFLRSRQTIRLDERTYGAIACESDFCENCERLVF